VEKYTLKLFKYANIYFYIPFIKSVKARCALSHLVGNMQCEISLSLGLTEKQVMMQVCFGGCL